MRTKSGNLGGSDVESVSCKLSDGEYLDKFDMDDSASVKWCNEG